MKINNDLPTVSTQNPPEPKYLDVETVPAIIYITENTIKLEVIATVMNDDCSINKASMNLNVAAVAEARIQGWDWEGENVKYRLTDETKRELGL